MGMRVQNFFPQKHRKAESAIKKTVQTVGLKWENGQEYFLRSNIALTKRENINEKQEGLQAIS